VLFRSIGGFFGSPTPDLYIRWMQFGLFSSHSRLHGAASRAPWAFGPEAEAALAKTLALRLRLMPYILSAAEACVRDCHPFIAPLATLGPNDPASRPVWDEYRFGPHMVAAPVFGGDMAEREFYLPEGRWRDCFTGEEASGKSWHREKVPLERFPLFARAGSEADIYGL
jgi:alpha-D-xyloside xylohydrolase